MSTDCAMKAIAVFVPLALFSLVLAKKSGYVTELQIGVKHRPKACEIQAHKGDQIKVHYRGKLTDGTVFDSSFERGDPIEFELGTGQVIKVIYAVILYNLGKETFLQDGTRVYWECEKRKLKIPAKLGYGEQGSPPTIPGGTTLVFDTELVAVNGQTGAGKPSDSEL